MGKINNLIGKKFGMLTVISFAYTKNKKSYWLCKCDCGTEKILRSDSFNTNRERRTKSCGCLNLQSRDYKITHGMSKTKLYHVWAIMKDRCINPNGKHFKHYGGKGVTVCDEWKNSYENFYDWAINTGYVEGLTIDRVNVNGNYEPSNCKWITIQEQQSNTTSNRVYTYNDKTLNISQWARETGIKRETLNARLNYGWSIEKALTTPVKK